MFLTPFDYFRKRGVSCRDVVRIENIFEPGRGVKVLAIDVLHLIGAFVVQGHGGLTQLLGCHGWDLVVLRDAHAAVDKVSRLAACLQGEVAGLDN